MFGNNQYWWGGLLILILFIGINIAVHLLRNKPELSYAIAYTIACFLLVYKVGEYIYWQAVGLHMRIPVEFSAISYLIFGITIVFKLKKFDQFPIFAAILAGMMYSISFWVAPDSHIFNPGDTPFLIAMAIINHHLLYFGGMLMLTNVRSLQRKNAWQHIVFTGAIVGYSWLIYAFTSYADQVGKPIIIDITDGSIINRVITLETLSTGFYIAYYCICIVLLAALIIGYYALNNLCVKRRAKKSLPEDYYPSSLHEIYRLAK